MKQCREIQTELSAYIDNELPMTARATVEQHVQGCSTCRERLADLKQLAIGVMALPKLQPVPGFLADVRGKIEGTAKRHPKAWRDYLFRPLWLKVPLEALAVVAIVLIAMRAERSGTERVGVRDKVAMPAAESASSAVVADGKPHVTEGLAPNRLVGSAAPLPTEPTADSVVVPAQDFDEAQNRVRQLAAAMSGRIVPPPQGKALTHVLFVELPPENLEAFKAQLQTMKPVNAGSQPYLANGSGSLKRAAGGGEKKTASVVLRIQVLPPAD
jgi:Putative zinc-finger